MAAVLECVIPGRWSADDHVAAQAQGWAIYFDFDPADGAWTPRERKAKWKIGVNYAGGVEIEDDEAAVEYVQQMAAWGDPLCARAWALMVEQDIMGHVDSVDVIAQITEG